MKRSATQSINFLFDHASNSRERSVPPGAGLFSVKWCVSTLVEHGNFAEIDESRAPWSLGRRSRFGVHTRVESGYYVEMYCQFQKKAYFQHALKTIKTLKTEQAPEISPEAALRGVLGRVPFVVLKRLRAGAEGWGLLGEVSDGDQEWEFLVESLSRSEPKMVRDKAAKVAAGVKSRGVPACGVLLGPHFSQDARQICRDANVSFIDWAGNCRLQFGKAYVEIVGNEPLRQVRRGESSIFSAKAARVLRVLLNGPLRSWKVVELAEAADSSVGRTSHVRQHLIDREWAIADEHGLRVTKPDALLDAWAAADRWEDRTEVREYSLLVTDPAEIAARVHGFLGGRRHAFTQWIAAVQRHPYTTPPVTTVYVEEFPDEALLKEALLARRVDSGGRLRLVLPADEGVLNPLQTARGLPLVSDVQLYLDLLRAGLRGDEAAAELRRWPDFAGGWA